MPISPRPKELQKIFKAKAKLHRKYDKATFRSFTNNR